MIVLITLFAFLFAMLIMSVGVIFNRPCLRGSCGGAQVLDSDGEPLSCSTCPNRDKNKGESGPAVKSGLPVVD